MNQETQKTTIYIAGPMRGIPYFNFLAFDDAAARLAYSHTVISPADMDRAAGFDPYKLPADYDWNTIPPEFDFPAAFERDLAAVRKCDGIYMLAGWENSKGARAKKAVAEWLGKKILYEAGAAVESSSAPAPAAHRTFSTGATRDTDADKLDFDGFLSAPVLRRFAEYMHKHRKMRDGSLRASDNWQKGIPREQYRKSAWRHFAEWWEMHRAGKDTTEAACALLFNLMGDTHEALKGGAEL